MLRANDPIRCPDGTWFILGPSVPLFWGSSEAAILSAVSERVGSVDAARELLKGADARWGELAERDPALHRALTRKLKPGWQTATPAPVVEAPRDRAKEAAEAALERRRQAAEARKAEREAAARAYEARRAEEERAERERVEEQRRRRAELRAAQSEENKRAEAERKAQEAAERKRAKEARRLERVAAIAEAREARKRAKPAWHEQARAMRREGYTLKEIGAAVRRGSSAVGLACAGIETPRVSSQLAKEGAEVLALHQSGKTYRQIAQELDRSIDWVQRRMEIARPKGYRAHRGGKPKISQSDSVEIRRRYEAGESTYQLAKAYKVAAITISEAVRRAGGEIRRERLRAVSDDELRACIAEGLTQAEIARRYSSHQSSISMRLLKLGLRATRSRKQQADDDDARQIAQWGYV